MTQKNYEQIASDGYLIFRLNGKLETDQLGPFEKDLELAYATPMRFGGKLTALAQVKLQPGHDADAPTQFGLGVRYVRLFK